MTEQDQDPENLRRISKRYRELGAEEPPRALDDAILAAARREAGARPGAPGRAAPRRWYASLAAAAVLVLAVAVTLHMQREQPDIAEPAVVAKAPVPAAAPAPAPVAAEAEARPKLRAEPPLKPAAEGRVEPVKPPSPKIAASPPPSVPEPFPAKEERAADIPQFPTAPQAVAPAPAPVPSAALSSRADEARGSASIAAGAVARQSDERAARSETQQRQSPMVQAPPPPPAARPAPAAAPRLAAKPVPLSERPVELTAEQELERIADLRRHQRHDEADKALAEFRKRHPDYKISGAMLERVERR